MTHSKFGWQNSQQENIFAQAWEISNPKALIAIVHGMGEHSTRYEHFATFFNQNGYSCYTFDQIGHGQSQGKRGHTENFDHLLDNIEKLIEHAQKQAPHLPLYLFGHSMGGNLVLNYAMRRPHKLKGLIVSAPWLRLAFEPPAIKMKLASFMNNIYPKFTEKSNLKGAQVTSNKTIAAAYDADPLIHGQISTRFFFGVSEAAKWVLNNPQKLTLPTLLLHGTGDTITSYQASKELAQKTGKNLTFETFEGWFHELHNETQHLKEFNIILDWMNE